MTTGTAGGRALGLAPLIAAALTLAACGGGSQSPSRSSSAALPPDYIAVPAGRGPGYRLPAASPAVRARLPIGGLRCGARGPTIRDPSRALRRPARRPGPGRDRGRRRRSAAPGPTSRAGRASIRCGASPRPACCSSRPDGRSRSDRRSRSGASRSVRGGWPASPGPSRRSSEAAAGPGARGPFHSTATPRSCSSAGAGSSPILPTVFRLGSEVLSERAGHGPRVERTRDPRTTALRLRLGPALPSRGAAVRDRADERIGGAHRRPSSWPGTAAGRSAPRTPTSPPSRSPARTCSSRPPGRRGSGSPTAGSTFASNGRRGVLITFGSPGPGDRTAASPRADRDGRRLRGPRRGTRRADRHSRCKISSPLRVTTIAG